MYNNNEALEQVRKHFKDTQKQSESAGYYSQLYVSKAGKKKSKCRITADPRKITAATHQLGDLLGQSLHRATCTKLGKGRLKIKRQDLVLLGHFQPPIPLVGT